MFYQSVIVAFLVCFVPYFAWKKKALSASASVICGMMIVISAIPGYKYALFIVLAFLLTSVFDKVLKNQNIIIAESQIIQKAGTRDALQVLVNGGVAIISIFAWYLSPHNILLICFITAINEAFGDSMASTIGIAYGKKTYDIVHFQEAPAGFSGGISIIGTIGCFASCILMGYIALLFGIARTKDVFLITVSAFAGCLIDSFLGATIQRKNKCSICGKITEKSIHCGCQTELHSGRPMVDNDIVNLISNLSSAIIVLLLSLA